MKKGKGSWPDTAKSCMESDSLLSCPDLDFLWSKEDINNHLVELRELEKVYKAYRIDIKNNNNS